MSLKLYKFKFVRNADKNLCHKYLDDIKKSSGAFDGFKQYDIVVFSIYTLTGMSTKI